MASRSGRALLVLAALVFILWKLPSPAGPSTGGITGPQAAAVLQPGVKRGVAAAPPARAQHDALAAEPPTAASTMRTGVRGEGSHRFLHGPIRTTPVDLADGARHSAAGDATIYSAPMWRAKNFTLEQTLLPLPGATCAVPAGLAIGAPHSSADNAATYRASILQPNRCTPERTLLPPPGPFYAMPTGPVIGVLQPTTGTSCRDVITCSASSSHPACGTLGQTVQQFPEPPPAMPVSTAIAALQPPAADVVTYSASTSQPACRACERTSLPKPRPQYADDTASTLLSDETATKFIDGASHRKTNVNTTKNLDQHHSPDATAHKPARQPDVITHNAMDVIIFRTVGFSSAAAPPLGAEEHTYATKNSDLVTEEKYHNHHATAYNPTKNLDAYAVNATIPAAKEATNYPTIDKEPIVNDTNRNHTTNDVNDPNWSTNIDATTETDPKTHNPARAKNATNMPTWNHGTTDLPILINYAYPTSAPHWTPGTTTTDARSQTNRAAGPSILSLDCHTNHGGGEHANPATGGKTDPNNADPVHTKNATNMHNGSSGATGLLIGINNTHLTHVPHWIFGTIMTGMPDWTTDERLDVTVNIVDTDFIYPRNEANNPNVTTNGATTDPPNATPPASTTTRDTYYAHVPPWTLAIRTTTINNADAAKGEDVDNELNPTRHDDDDATIQRHAASPHGTNTTDDAIRNEYTNTENNVKNPNRIAGIDADTLLPKVTAKMLYVLGMPDRILYPSNLTATATTTTTATNALPTTTPSGEPRTTTSNFSTDLDNIEGTNPVTPKEANTRGNTKTINIFNGVTNVVNATIPTNNALNKTVTTTNATIKTTITTNVNNPNVATKMTQALDVYNGIPDLIDPTTTTTTTTTPPHTLHATTPPSTAPRRRKPRHRNATLILLLLTTTITHRPRKRRHRRKKSTATVCARAKWRRNWALNSKRITLHPPAKNGHQTTSEPEPTPPNPPSKAETRLPRPATSRQKKPAPRTKAEKRMLQSWTPPATTRQPPCRISTVSGIICRKSYPHPAPHNHSRTDRTTPTNTQAKARAPNTTTTPVTKPTVYFEYTTTHIERHFRQRANPRMRPRTSDTPQKRKNNTHLPTLVWAVPRKQKNKQAHATNGNTVNQHEPTVLPTTALDNATQRDTPSQPDLAKHNARRAPQPQEPPHDPREKQVNEQTHTMNNNTTNHPTAGPSHDTTAMTMTPSTDRPAPVHPDVTAAEQQTDTLATQATTRAIRTPPTPAPTPPAEGSRRNNNATNDATPQPTPNHADSERDNTTTSDGEDPTGDKTTDYPATHPDQGAAAMTTTSNRTQLTSTHPHDTAPTRQPQAPSTTPAASQTTPEPTVPTQQPGVPSTTLATSQAAPGATRTPLIPTNDAMLWLLLNYIDGDHETPRYRPPVPAFQAPAPITQRPASSTQQDTDETPTHPGQGTHTPPTHHEHTAQQGSRAPRQAHTREDNTGGEHYPPPPDREAGRPPSLGPADPPHPLPTNPLSNALPQSTGNDSTTRRATTSPSPEKDGGHPSPASDCEREHPTFWSQPDPPHAPATNQPNATQTPTARRNPPHADNRPDTNYDALITTSAIPQLAQRHADMFGASKKKQRPQSDGQTANQHGPVPPPHHGSRQRDPEGHALATGPGRPPQGTSNPNTAHPPRTTNATPPPRTGMCSRRQRR